MRHATLAFIFVTVALDMLALGIIVPVLPMLVAGGRGATLSGAPYLLAAGMLAVGFVLAWQSTQG